MGSKVKYSDLKKSDFFKFFNCREAEEPPQTADPIERKKIKTGGFQEYIDIELFVNDLDEIVRALLFLARSWVGDDKSINPFANDITKSFIGAIVPPDEKSKVEPLIYHLFKIKGKEDIVYTIHQESAPFGEPSPEEVSFLEVYRNLRPSFEIPLEYSKLSIENTVENDTPTLVICWTSF